MATASPTRWQGAAVCRCCFAATTFRRPTSTACRCTHLSGKRRRNTATSYSGSSCASPRAREPNGTTHSVSSPTSYPAPAGCHAARDRRQRSQPWVLRYHVRSHHRIEAADAAASRTASERQGLFCAVRASSGDPHPLHPPYARVLLLPALMTTPSPTLAANVMSPAWRPCRVAGRARRNAGRTAGAVAGRSRQPDRGRTALCTAMLHRHEHQDVFDQAFNLFWRDPICRRTGSCDGTPRGAEGEAPGPRPARQSSRRRGDGEAARRGASGGGRTADAGCGADRLRPRTPAARRTSRP